MHCAFQALQITSAELFVTTYLWLVPPQPGMLERGLQVRRHAVDDVAVWALQTRSSSSAEQRTRGKINSHSPLQLQDDDHGQERMNACLDRLDGGIPGPGELGLDPLEPEQLLGRPERHRRAIAIAAAASSSTSRGGDDGGEDDDEEEEEEGNKRGNDWAAAGIHPSIRVDLFWRRACCPEFSIRIRRG